MSSPKSPTGKKTLGKKTRKAKVSDKFILERRKK
jgi:ribosomal protein L2